MSSSFGTVKSNVTRSRAQSLASKERAATTPAPTTALSRTGPSTAPLASTW
jgi:hypothetical protein